MRYIRTKDGIEAYNESCDLSYVYQSVGGIKIADTIEELCDEFVCDNKVFHTFREMLAYKCNANIKSYGAIWTDKGLIYVAKMNDKGEMELLWKIKMVYTQVIIKQEFLIL